METVETDDNTNINPNNRNNCGNSEKKDVKVCSRFMSVLCSNLGVCLIVVVYTCVGAFLFTSLEGANNSHLLSSYPSSSQYRASLSRHEGVIATRDRHPSSSSSMNTAPSSIEERIEIMVF